MIIENKTLSVVYIGALRLLPGMNEVEESDFKTFEKGIKLQSDWGHLKIVNAEIQDELEDGIVKYSAADAVELINGTFEEDKILEYQEQEKSGKSRKKVLKAIDAKLKVLKEALVKDKKGDLD